MQSPSSSNGGGGGLLNGVGPNSMLMVNHGGSGLGGSGGYTNDHQQHPNQQQQQQQQQHSGNGQAMWSNLDDGSSAANHMSSHLNGYNNYPNFNNSPIFNGASPNSIATALSQQNRRAITASHGGNNGGGCGSGSVGSNGGYQHGMSPNSMGRSSQIMQSQQQQPKHNQGGFNNNYPAWSNPPPSVAWPGGNQMQQQHQSNHGQNMASWNRGRSVPNLNPMTNMMNRKPTSPNPGLSPSAYSAGGGGIGGGSGHQVISPVKYRRSTSFPGKIHGPGHGSSVGGYSGGNSDHSSGGMDEGNGRGDPFMQPYHQVNSTTGQSSLQKNKKHPRHFPVEPVQPSTAFTILPNTAITCAAIAQFHLCSPLICVDFN